MGGKTAAKEDGTEELVFEFVHGDGSGNAFDCVEAVDSLNKESKIVVRSMGGAAALAYTFLSAPEFAGQPEAVAWAATLLKNALEFYCGAEVYRKEKPTQ